METQTSTALAVKGVVDLDSMSAWGSYKKDRQERLWEIAGEIRESQWTQGFAALREATAIYKAKQELTREGEFREFLEKVYQGSSRNGYERLKLYVNANKRLSKEQIAYLVSYGPSLMPYRNLPMGEFLNATNALPIPKSDKPEHMNPFIEQIGIKFKELKSQRRKEGQRKFTKDEAAKEGFNHLLHLLSNAKIRTAQQKKEFLEWIVGMVWEDQAIPGKASISRVEVPEGFKVRRGRPPKDKSSKTPPPLKKLASRLDRPMEVLELPFKVIAGTIEGPLKVRVR